MNAPEQVSINELLRRIKEGDQSARKQLFSLLGDENEFGTVMLAMTHRFLPKDHWARRFVDTRDIVQSALRTGLRHLSDFRGEYEGELFNWFRAIIRTKVHRLSRLKEPATADEKRTQREARLPISDIIDEEFLQLLHTAIRKLPLHERVVVELRLRGVNAPDIGQMLGLKAATVRKRESRAVGKLKGLVE